MAILNLKKFGFIPTGEETINDLVYQIYKYEPNDRVILKKYVKKPNINLEIYIDSDKVIDLIDYDYDELCSGFSSIMDRINNSLNPNQPEEVVIEQPTITETTINDTILVDTPVVSVVDKPIMNYPEFEGPHISTYNEAFEIILKDLINNIKHNPNLSFSINYDNYDLTALTKKEVSKLKRDMDAVCFALMAYIQKYK